MHLKNIIMFFCVALYFLQCQGEDPNKIRNVIKSIVAQNVGPSGIDFEELKDIYRLTTRELDMKKCLPRIDKLNIDFKCSKNRIEILALAFVATEDEINTKFVKDTVMALEGQGDIGLDKLKAVYIKVAEKANFRYKFPLIASLQKESTDRQFTKEEVLTLALAFLASNQLLITGFIQSMVATYENDMNYKDFADIINAVKQKTRIDKPFPSYNEYKAKYFKFTKEEVEKIVIDDFLQQFD